MLNFADYEILNEYPFTIRRKDNHKEVKETLSKGYIQISINGKTYGKHRLIALHFLPNPNNLSDVDYINHNRDDYHLENLRWINHSKNMLNSSSYRGVTARYLDQIDPEAMVVDYYETKTERHYLIGYYYHDGVFYYDNDMNYRILNVNSTRWGSRYVNMMDVDGKQVKLVVARFLEQHDMA